MASGRPKHANLEKGRAVVRGLHLEQLEQAGSARAAALREADEQLDRIARLLPAALQGGLGLSEIGRVTGVSRPTLYELRGRYGDQPLDLDFAVLQAIATRGAATVSELTDHLRKSHKRLRTVVDSFAEQGFLDFDIEEDKNGPRQEWYLTSKGQDLLEAWPLERDEGAS